MFCIGNVLILTWEFFLSPFTEPEKDPHPFFCPQHALLNKTVKRQNLVPSQWKPQGKGKPTHNFWAACAAPRINTSICGKTTDIKFFRTKRGSWGCTSPITLNQQSKRSPGRAVSLAEAEGGKTGWFKLYIQQSGILKDFVEVKHQSLKCQQKLLREQEMPPKLKEGSNFMTHNPQRHFFYLLRCWKLPSSSETGWGWSFQTQEDRPSSLDRQTVHPVSTPLPQGFRRGWQRWAMIFFFF